MGTYCAHLVEGLFCCIAFSVLSSFSAIFLSGSWLIYFCFYWSLDIVWLLAHQRSLITTFVSFLLESIISKISTGEISIF